nr:radial spoke head 14 homolog [Vicugna pacos]
MTLYRIPVQLHRASLHIQSPQYLEFLNCTTWPILLLQQRHLSLGFPGKPRPGYKVNRRVQLGRRKSEVSAGDTSVRAVEGFTGGGGQLAHLQHLSCPAGAQGIVSSGLIPSLVWKLQREEERIQALLLDTLAACLMEDATEALASCVVPFLKEKLLSANSDIRAKAARTLIAVSIPLEGKNQVWQHDVIPILVHLLKDKVDEVQANAAGALMYATVTTKGKYAALDAEAIRPLLELLHLSSSKVRLNAIKALTMLAEAPEGRKLLQAHVPTFRALEKDASAAVRQAAQIAIQVIEWKP